MLHVVHTRPAVDPTLPERLEDDLIRSGARGAHLLEDGAIAVTVAASTLHDAIVLVQDLMARACAGTPETVDAILAGHDSTT